MRRPVPARPDVVLFDLDGTLTDPKVGITLSMQHALAAVGVSVDEPETLIAEWMKHVGTGVPGYVTPKIAVGAVVNRDVEPFTVVGGVPAKPIAKIDPARFRPERLS